MFRVTLGLKTNKDEKWGDGQEMKVDEYKISPFSPI